MITESEKSFIRTHAYVPEHIVEYGEAISGGEPYLFDNFLCYVRGSTLIVVGYPLKEVFIKRKVQKIIDSMIKRFKAQRLAVIAPEDVVYGRKWIEHNSDHYYRYELVEGRIPSKVRNMINRSHKELIVSECKELTDEHRELIRAFLESHRLQEDVKYIYKRIPFYLAHSSSAIILNARNKEGVLIAFDIVDCGSQDYVFYMFNVTNEKHRIPGSSDLLLYTIVQRAKRDGYRFVNLGLGINRGVTFFKEKWGGEPFLTYEYYLYNLTQEAPLLDLLQKL